MDRAVSSASHRGKPVASGPAVDLPDVFDDKRVAQLLAQGDAPQSDHRMRLAVGSRDGQLGIFCFECAIQP